VGSGIVTCLMAPELASRLRWAPVLSRVLCLWTLPPDWGGLRRCHVACGSGPHLLTGAGSGAGTCPTAPCGPQVSSINKSLIDLSVQLNMHVPNARAHVSKAPHVRVIMCLQDVRAGSVVSTYKACERASTVRLQSYGPLIWHRYSAK
jgi:hypothetical protein